MAYKPIYIVHHTYTYMTLNCPSNLSHYSSAASTSVPALNLEIYDRHTGWVQNYSVAYMFTKCLPRHSISLYHSDHKKAYCAKNMVIRGMIKNIFFSIHFVSFLALRHTYHNNSTNFPPFHKISLKSLKHISYTHFTIIS